MDNLNLYLAMLSFLGGGIIPPLIRLLLPDSKNEGHPNLTRFSLFFCLTGSILILYGIAESWLNPPTLSSPSQTVDLKNFANSPIAALKSMIEPNFSPYLDKFALFFLALVALFALLIALYSWEWLVEDAQEINGQAVVGVFNLLIFFAVFTLMVNNVFYFLLGLEGNTLAFSYLALYRYKQNLKKPDDALAEQESTRASFKIYPIFNHTGIILVTAALAILSVQYRSLDFSNFRASAHNHQIDGGLVALVFILGLIGYSIKIGITPFHVWVIQVHPNTPTSTHAIQSGILLKVAGLYGMVRLFFDFLQPEWWWGIPTLVLASLTVLVGVFYAIINPDLKKALALHSVENMGIILTGVGLALLLSYGTDGKPLAGGIARMALLAGLFHALNYTVFKGLLFLSADAIENRVGTVKFDKLGGLMKAYPWTASTFLVGAVSIAGLPPFNGFYSEWLLLQSFFSGFASVRQSKELILPSLALSVVFLGTAFGLTALAFVKIVGESLLGNARQKLPEKKKDVPWLMRTVLVALAAACLLLGMYAQPVVDRLEQVVGSLSTFQGTTSISAGSPKTGPDITIYLQDSNGALAYRSDLSYPVLLIVLAVLIIPAIVAAVWFARKPENLPSPWNGGEGFEPDKMQYTSSAFSSLIWLPFSRPRLKDPKSANNSDKRRWVFLPERLQLTSTREVIEYFSLAYNRITYLLLKVSKEIGKYIHNGDIRRYLTFIFVIFITLLIIGFIWG